MSEVQTRSQAPASRGRGGGRGGRGGFGGRSEARSGNTRPNGGKTTSDAFDEDGDIGQLRKQYGDKVDTIKGIFSDWSDADILYALQETDGEIEVAVTRISEGSISQWGEVSKPKKTAKTKPTGAPLGLNEASGNSRPARGGRADGGRGGRGARGSDRARGGRGRGSSIQPATNGHRAKDNQLSVPTEEAPGWGSAAAVTTDDIPANEWGTPGWGTNDTTKETTTTTTTTTPAKTTTTAPAPAAAAAAAESNVPKPKTWASMLRQSTAPPPKPAAKPQEAPAPKPAEAIEPLPPVEPTPAEPEPVVEEKPKEVVEELTPAPVPAPAPAPVPVAVPTPVAVPVAVPAPVEPEVTAKVVEPEVALPPSEVDLTKRNLDQLPDESHPPATATVASTTADSWDPRQGAQQSAAATPLSAAQAQHQAARSGASGYAATALKATERPTRVPSYQRRVLEQEEAVRLPGNREVDRAAVQFGAFSLNGAEDDIDGDREEAETRAQPPSDSPVQPRAALPPVAQPTQPAAIPDTFPAAAAQKPAAALPQPAAAAAPVAPPTGPSAGTAAPRMSSQYTPQDVRSTNPEPEAFNQQYGGRFGQANVQDQSSFPPKPYDSFVQQPATTSAAGFDSFPAPATQAPNQPSAFSSAPNDYSSYYTADQHSRGSYNNYYGQAYGQQGAPGHNEGPGAQRPFGGYNASQTNDNLSQYPQSAQQQSRYGANAAVDAHNSGHNTPNPTAPGQQQQQQQPQQQSAQNNNGPQSNLHQQQPPAGGFPTAHPYYNSPYYSQYMNYYGGFGQGGYGGGRGLYGQPHQYGMSHQSPYEHSSSPATSGFGQSALGARDSAMGSSIDNYGRAGSAQSGAQGLAGSGFGGAHDAFNRAGSSYQSQAGQGFSGPNAQAASASDDLKPYGENKAAAGPSPSLAGGARPGSAANNAPGQSGLPPPQSSGQGMGGYGGYPNHLQSHGLHGNQTAGSGFGQAHANYGGAYGNYGQGFGSYGGGRGWGSNYQ